LMLKFDMGHLFFASLIFSLLATVSAVLPDNQA